MGYPSSSDPGDDIAGRHRQMPLYSSQASSGMVDPGNYPETGLAEMSGDFLEAAFALPI
jgi:hypothetical protein